MSKVTYRYADSALELAGLRRRRSKLEVDYALHPSRTKAVVLAALYEEMRDAVLASAGLGLTQAGEVPVPEDERELMP